jgi:hypothetical protein
MKNNNLRKVYILIASFVAVTSVFAQQEDKAYEHRSFGKWLVETPWEVGFGGSVISDNTSVYNSSQAFFNNTYFPARFSAEKSLKMSDLSMQLVIASTSFKPHGFAEVDINFKYDFSFLFGESKSFESYALIGAGLTYRDNGYDKFAKTYYDDNFQPSFNTAFGTNFWITKSMAINLEGQAKFAKDQYLQANIGLVFKINPIKSIPILRPKSKEAKHALQHLRGIINK